MVRTLFTAIVGVLVAVPVSRGDGKDARAILDKAIAAHGSNKANDVKVHVWKVKGTMTAGGMEMKYQADYYFCIPNQFRFDLEMDADGMVFKLSAASDGKTAWEQSGETLREMDAKKREAFDHNVYTMNLSFLLPLKDKAYTLSALGESKLKDQTVVGILVKRKGKRDVRLFFDTKTGLLAKTQTRIFDEFSGKEVQQETLFSGYEDKDGIKTFGKITVLRADKVFIVEELSAQEGRKQAAPDLFSKPKSE